MNTEAKPHAGRRKIKEKHASFKLTSEALAFLASLPRGTRTAFIEQQIKASAQYQHWQTK